MYLWKTSNLVAELKAGTMSEKDKMLYVLITGLAYGVMSDPLFSVGIEYSILDWAGLVLMIFTTVLGTLYGYKMNREGDNRDFITRYVSLSVPVGVRLFLVALVGGVIIGFVEGAFTDGSERDSTNQTTLTQLVFMTTLSAFYYSILGERIEDVSKSSDA